MKDAIFCTATAGDRYDQVLSCMKSIRLFHPDADLRCDAIDFSDDEVGYLENDIGVKVERFSFSEPLPDLFDLPALEEHAARHEREKGYKAFEGTSLACAAWRLFMIPRIMQEENRPIVWLDSDCLANKKLDGFIDRSLRHDLSIHFRPGNPDHSKVLSSVFVANNTDKGKRFCELLGPSYRSVYKKVDWWADPYSLFLARRDFGGTDWNFPAKVFNDSRLHDDAVIWHAKHSGIDKPKWKKACKKVVRADLDGAWSGP